MLARCHKKFQREQHSEIYLLTLKEQDKTKMELPLDMVSKHAFWYPYLPDYKYILDQLKTIIVVKSHVCCVYNFNKDYYYYYNNMHISSNISSDRTLVKL